MTLGLLPLLLVYCVAGAITDMLNVWPFLLSLLLLHQAWQGQSAGRALGAGALLALGFVLCPYNVLVFAPALLPLGLGLYLGLPQRFGLAAWPGGKPALRLVASAALGGITSRRPLCDLAQADHGGPRQPDGGRVRGRHPARLPL